MVNLTENYPIEAIMAMIKKTNPLLYRMVESAETAGSDCNAKVALKLKTDVPMIGTPTVILEGIIHDGKKIPCRVKVNLDVYGIHNSHSQQDWERHEKFCQMARQSWEPGQLSCLIGFV